MIVSPASRLTFYGIIREYWSSFKLCKQTLCLQHILSHGECFPNLLSNKKEKRTDWRVEKDIWYQIIRKELRKKKRHQIQFHKNHSHTNGGKFFELSVSLFPLVFPFSSYGLSAIIKSLVSELLPRFSNSREGLRHKYLFLVTYRI